VLLRARPRDGGLGSSREVCSMSLHQFGVGVTDSTQGGGTFATQGGGAP
jgi:hypothetical protein